MGVFDSFINNKGEEIQVKCFDTVGGAMNSFNLGDIVMTNKLDENFNIVAEYGDNFNIFPYKTEEEVIIIRNSTFKCTVNYNNLTDKDCEGIKCIDKFGNGLDVDLPIDYEELYKNFRSN